MNTYADKTKENRRQSGAQEERQKKSSAEPTSPLMNHRPEVIAQKKLEEMANNSPQVKQLSALQEMVDSGRAQQTLPETHMVGESIQRAVIQCYPSYQTFKDDNGNVYCSSVKLKNHDEGAAWVRAAIAALGVSVRGRPRESDDQPGNALIGPPWPAPPVGAQAVGSQDVDDQPARPLSAYEDPSTSRESRALIERGLFRGEYPPRR